MVSSYNKIFGYYSSFHFVAATPGLTSRVKMEFERMNTCDTGAGRCSLALFENDIMAEILLLPHTIPSLPLHMHIHIHVSITSTHTHTDSTNSPEYETVIQCTSMLRTAVQDHLLTLSGHLLGRHLISPEQDGELRNERHSESSRAAGLVKMVQGRVKLSPKWYHTFIEVLEREEDNFKDILKYLKDTYSSLTSGAECQPYTFSELTESEPVHSFIYRGS